MIQTIISVFTIYTALSSAKPGRLLLQNGQPPEFIPDPAAQPPVPAIPPAVPGTPPVDPAANPAAPATLPADPAVWVPPALPSPNSFQTQTVLECTLPNTAVAGCAGRITSLTNPGENFALKCSNVGACAAATLDFTFNNAYTERVEIISFSEQYAGYGATINIDSTNSLRKQYIDKFQCTAPGACLNTNVRLIGGASLNDVHCAYPQFCQNCNIEVCEWGPNGVLLCGTPKPCFNY